MANQAYYLIAEYINQYCVAYAIVSLLHLHILLDAPRYNSPISLTLSTNNSTLYIHIPHYVIACEQNLIFVGPAAVLLSEFLRPCIHSPLRVRTHLPSIHLLPGVSQIFSFRSS